MDLLVTDPVTGKQTGLDRSARAALNALRAARVPFSVIGATALAVRGFPRMTRDLDVVVGIEDAAAAHAALAGAGFQAATPTGDSEEPEPMAVFVDPETKVEVDVLAAAGDPERRVIAEAPRTKVFGVEAPVATLEHLLLMYLYSNQPRHLGDFATIVQSGRADLAAAAHALAEFHPEMVEEWRTRVAAAQNPPPPPKRPPRRAP